MKFKDDVLWLDRDEKLLLMGLSDEEVVVVTGPLKDELLQFLKTKASMASFLSTQDRYELKMLLLCKGFLETAEKSAETLDQLKLKLENSNEFEFLKLDSHVDGNLEEYAVFAKYPDPTAIVGIGGYDDDTSGPTGTMAM